MHADPLAAAGGGSFNDVLGEIGQPCRAAQTSPSLAEQLVQAGYHDRRAAAVFLGAKAVLLIAGAVGFGLLVLLADIAAGRLKVIVGDVRRRGCCSSCPT